MMTTAKKAFLSILLVAIGLDSFGQTIDTNYRPRDYLKPFSPDTAFRTWSFGFYGGLLTPFTVFGGYTDFIGHNEHFGYGGFIKDEIVPSFGLQMDYFTGQLNGNTAASADGTPSPYASFSTQVKGALSLTGVITLANINYNHKNSYVQPYFMGGAGAMLFSGTVYDYKGVATEVHPTGRASYIELFVPIGVGFKIDVTREINFDIGYNVNFVDADILDGYKYGTTNDRFSFIHLGLEFTLGKSSEPRMVSHNPVSSMRTEYLDGINGLQKQLKKVQAQAAADKAKTDSLKLQNNLLAGQLNDAKNSITRLDAGLAKLTLDSDGDGVPDVFDKCPNTPAGTKVDGSGCPLPVDKPVEKVVVVTEEDKRVVKDAIANLEFDLGKATIRPFSFASLDKVANLLISKNFSLKLAGHTDNKGSAELNLRLSKDRAESIKSYLVSRGANPSRIEATGYGMSQPIATNKTAEGRQQNRRVEFTLY